MTNQKENFESRKGKEGAYSSSFQKTVKTTDIGLSSHLLCLFISLKNNAAVSGFTSGTLSEKLQLTCNA